MSTATLACSSTLRTPINRAPPSCLPLSQRRSRRGILRPDGIHLGHGAGRRCGQVGQAKHNLQCPPLLRPKCACLDSEDVQSEGVVVGLSAMVCCPICPARVSTRWWNGSSRGWCVTVMTVTPLRARRANTLSSRSRDMLLVASSSTASSAPASMARRRRTTPILCASPLETSSRPPHISSRLVKRSSRPTHPINSVNRCVCSAKPGWSGVSGALG
mmetsp:Transcript_13425/g.28953  ORF Transcript_13425/g.28953 Transcript_13425/m.28953 type:complete len:216 (+) Transcript_13425:329-976(+)